MGGSSLPAFGNSPPIAALPPGVTAVWDEGRAFRETTPTRERVCLNGLWLWQPAETQSTAPPQSDWGWFKVPGSWPGITDYMQKDCQMLYMHPSWSSRALGGVNAAWYQREFTVPQNWTARRTSLYVAYLNSYAAVFLNSKLAGEIRFPAGELDLTSFCQPGSTNVLNLLVVAMP